jgi:hypothetical protein
MACGLVDFVVGVVANTRQEQAPKRAKATAIVNYATQRRDLQAFDDGFKLVRS